MKNYGFYSIAVVHSGHIGPQRFTCGTINSSSTIQLFVNKHTYCRPLNSPVLSHIITYCGGCISAFCFCHILKDSVVVKYSELQYHSKIFCNLLLDGISGLSRSKRLLVDSQYHLANPWNQFHYIWQCIQCIEKEARDEKTGLCLILMKKTMKKSVSETWKTSMTLTLNDMLK